MSDNDQDDISAADEQALRAMFAALVDDAAPSELSPLEVRRSATSENDATLDRRLKRLKFTRNALVAAALAGVVALLLPHLGSTSTGTAASSSASAAAAGAIPQSAGAAADGSSAASSAPASGGASGSSAAGGAAPAPAVSSAAGSAASSGAMSSGGASGGSSAAGPSASSASASASSGVAGCLPGSARWFAPVRAALPGYRGTVRITSCSVEDSRGSAAGTVTFVVSTATSAVCQGAAAGGCQPVDGTPVPGTKDAYVNGAAVTVVGARGVSVTVTSAAGGPDRQALITAARALLTTIG